MSNNLKTNGIGRVIPTPSGRRSIHDHPECLFSSRKLKVTREMGRYGDIDEEGKDETDNVFSKPVRQRSPIPIRNSNDKRRNSDSNYLFRTEESSNDVLAKSLPAYLWNNYSDEEPGSLNQTAYTTEESRISNHSSSSHHNGSDQYLQSDSQNEINDTQTNHSFQWSILAVLIVSFLIWQLKGSYLKYEIKNYDSSKYLKDMNRLGQLYKISYDSILQVQTGISSISEKADTGSFIFLYNSINKQFNETKFYNFINDVALVSAQFLRNESKSVSHLIVESATLDMKTHGELISRYRDVVDKSGVMLIKELDCIPSVLAMAFHYYCDEYNPLVKKSAIFFTLDLARCSTLTGRKTSHSYIEKCLADKWSLLPEDNVNPLLTRVVNIVIDLTNEF